MGIMYSEPICQAAYNGDLHQVYKQLQDEDKNLNVQDAIFGDSPLIAACKSGNIRTVKYLLEQNADVTIRNKKERTCLHYAAKRTFSFLDFILIVVLMPILLIGYLLKTEKEKKHVDLLETLLSCNVEINAVDYKGNTALHYACLCKSHKIIAVLLRENADLTIRNKDGETAFDIAQRLKFSKVITLLHKSK